MSNSTPDRGFTLIEVMVVISIIAVLLYFSVPVFKTFTAPPDTDRKISDFIGLIQSLKQKAVDEGTDYFLHIDPGNGAIFVTHEYMDEEMVHQTKNSDDISFDGLMIHDIVFPEVREIRFPPIRFSKQGYSDMALIHIRGDQGDVTLKIEPFLLQVEQENRYVSYQDCM